MCNIQKPHCQQFLGGITGHFAKSGIDSTQASSLRIHLRLPNPGQLEIGPKLLFARAERFFRALSLINVDNRADPLAHTAIGVVYRRTLCTNVMIRPITLPDSVVGFNRGRITQGLLPDFTESLSVVRMDNGHPSEPSVLFGCLTGHFLPAAYFESIAVGCGPPARRVHHVRKGPVTFFTGAQGMDGFVTHLSRSQLRSDTCQQLTL